MRLQIEQGILDGGEERSVITGRTFYTFMNIPYGEPPVGELRFRPPRPAGKWTGVRDAKGEPEWCTQRVFGERHVVGSEDCLNINVFTSEPPNPDAPLKPVMVHFPGGGFMHGSGSMKIASFDHLVDYNVVMVTFSHRIHILGYFNLNTPSCTGNCGAKDQILALKWIQKNIRSFGGDPNNVTIFGESAGAASVHLLSISPLTKGLYHKAIIQSAHALVPWAFRQDQVDVGFQIGRRLGFEGSDPEELANFLRKQPVEVLQTESWNAMRAFKQENPFHLKTLLFVPSLDTCAEEVFLPDYPMNLVKTASPLPTIVGVAEKEGATILLDAEDHNIFATLKDDLSGVVRQNVTPNASKVTEVSALLKEFYSNAKNGTKNGDTTSFFIDLFSDLFNVHLYDSFKYVIQSPMPLYVYKFTYCGNLNESQYWHMDVPGCLHADETNYITLSRSFFPNPSMNESDRIVSRNLCTLWTNFARSGNPNPPPVDAGDEWIPYTRENPCYLRIDEKVSHEKGVLYEKASNLWKKIFETYSNAQEKCCSIKDSTEI